MAILANFRDTFLGPSIATNGKSLVRVKRPRARFQPSRFQQNKRNYTGLSSPSNRSEMYDP